MEPVLPQKRGFFGRSENPAAGYFRLTEYSVYLLRLPGITAISSASPLITTDEDKDLQYTAVLKNGALLRIYAE